MNSDEFAKIDGTDLVHVIGHRGAVDHQHGLVLLAVTLATTQRGTENPQKAMLALTPEEAEKVVSSLQTSLTALRRSN